LRHLAIVQIGIFYFTNVLFRDIVTFINNITDQEPS